MLTLCVVVAAVALAGLAVVLMLRAVRRISDAYAWDPNSHDKIVSHAIDLLATGPAGDRLTLIGWVFSELRQQGETAAFFLTNLEHQIRRGSVEEDMNSSILVHQLYDWGGVDSLEGTNGGYHFYNPETGFGLTDCSFLPLVFGQVGSGCKSPMPSAKQRATELKGCGLDPGGCSPEAHFVLRHINAAALLMPYGEFVSAAFNFWGAYYLATAYPEWHMDEEGRNYSFHDSDQYFLYGYSHLASYTIGRIAHLLSDMAVPAHVRNDSHAGTLLQHVGFDPSDPLEVYAERKDMKLIGANEESKDPQGKHIYAFNPKRVYPSPTDVFERALSGAVPDGNRVQGTMSYRQVREANREQLAELFDALASDTYSKCYSYNTIPGNLHAHHPRDVEEQYALRGVVDWTKCGLETDAIKEVLECFCMEANAFLNATTFPETLGKTTEQIRQEALLAQTLVWKIQAAAGPVPEKYILGISPLHNVLGIELVRDILKKLPEWAPFASWVASNLNPNEDADAQLALNFFERYEELNIAQLTPIANSADDTTKAFRQWMDGPSRPREEALRKWFVFTSEKWQMQGPFALTDDIIGEQFLDRQGAAVAHCATLFANWFESLYASKVRKWGFGAWLNKKPETPEAIPTVDAIALLEPNAPQQTIEDVAWVGVVNHFPTPVELSAKIELVNDGSDPNEPEEGVRLELDWGTLIPKLTPRSQLEFSMTPDVMDPGGPAPGTYTLESTYVDDQLSTYLKQFGEGFEPKLCTKKLPAITLGGAKGTSVATVKLDGACPPYNLEAMMRLQLPLGEWAPGNRKMGGITRDKEQDEVFGKPVAPWPEETAGRDRMTASFLRITAMAADDGDGTTEMDGTSDADSSTPAGSSSDAADPSTPLGASPPPGLPGVPA